MEKENPPAMPVVLTFRYMDGRGNDSRLRRAEACAKTLTLPMQCDILNDIP